jgi:hypothetical protein
MSNGASSAYTSLSLLIRAASALNSRLAFGANNSFGNNIPQRQIAESMNHAAHCLRPKAKHVRTFQDIVSTSAARYLQSFVGVRSSGRTAGGRLSPSDPTTRWSNANSD